MGAKKGYKQSATHIEARFRNWKPKKGHIAHNRMTTSSFISQLKENWPECPYSLSKVNYVTNSVKVTLICEKHGDFLKWPSDALNRSGCPKCSGVGFTKEEYLRELVDMFPQYDFTASVYRNALANMKIICREHGPFELSRNALLNGTRCVQCTKIRLAKERILAGRARDPSTLSEYEAYRREVWKESGKSYREHRAVLGERSRTRHLDHVYSILHGFRDSIPPIILGNIVNLRIIDSKRNQSKSMNSDYTKDELMKLYEERNT